MDLYTEVGNQISARIAELQKDAVEGNEPFSEASHADLRRFLVELAVTQRPSIFLLDNGNLRVSWDNREKELVALQFLGQGEIQFVLFQAQATPGTMSRTHGVKNFTDTLAMLDDYKRITDCSPPWAA